MTTTIYSKPNCQQCDATKRALEKRGVEYVEADALDPDNLAAIKALGLSGAPVVVTLPDNEELGRERVWSGYRPDLIDDSFGRAYRA